jgi:two-component system nitrate/nitrite response regulator NarL
MSGGVHILLIDDHALFRESLVRLLAVEAGLSVVGHCATIAEARRIMSATSVDVVLLDYDLGEESGTDLLKYLHQTESKARVLVLTAGMRASATLTALDSGAAGVILKHSGTRQLLEAINRVAQGETWWDTALLRAALTDAKDKTDILAKARELTDRQRVVLRCILDGLSNKEIAAQLRTSETLVKATIQELFNKAGVRTRSQLVRVAIERFSAEWLQNPTPVRSA